MDRVYIADAANHVDQSVTIKGWVHNKTHKGKLLFIMLRDGTGMIQTVVFKGNFDSDYFDELIRLSQESAILVTGKIVEDKRSKGGFELQADEVTIHHEAQEYPITPKEHGIEFLMDHRHLWLRSTKQNALLKVRHKVIKASRDFLDNNGFTLIDAPIFTPSACEGTTNLFETEYFDSQAYLTQSGQLYMEAGAMAFGKVYCFGPTFRAEKSKTRRHLTEFWMVEPEIAYCDLQENMIWAEKMVEYVAQYVLNTCEKELTLLERDLSKLEAIKAPFPRITYDNAAEILKKANSEFVYGDDFGAPDETILSQEFEKPLMVTHYPADVKAFYMKRDPDNLGRALCVDVLAPEGYGEIIGGGQREDNLDELLKRINEHDLPEEAFQWYTDLRRYGSVPHSGFGMGIERTVTWLTGTHHVREAIPFPRTMTRLYP